MGSRFVISRGQKIYPDNLNGYYASDRNGKRTGLITFDIQNDQCEIVTLDAFVKCSGIGTELIKKVIEEIKPKGCRRLWLITTNDNLDAVRFYQRRGFVIHAVHKNAIEKSRLLKPSIPLLGYYGIPVRDEIEMEMLLK